MAVAGVAIVIIVMLFGIKTLLFMGLIAGIVYYFRNSQRGSSGTPFWMVSISLYDIVSFN